MKMFFAVDHDTKLLGHFLRHYAALGCTEFFCSVMFNDPAAVEAQAAGYRLTTSLCTAGYDTELRFSELLRRNLDVLLARHVAADEWFLIADLDEMQEYPLPPAQLALECERNGYDCVMGRFVDRVAADGSFPEVDDRPLEEQFPLRLDITGGLMGATTSKVMMCRGHLQIGNGQHRIVGESHPHPQWCLVHHYKWKAGMVERVRARRDLLRRLDCVWWKESDTLLRYIDQGNGRIDVGNQRVQPPGDIANVGTFFDHSPRRERRRHVILP